MDIGVFRWISVLSGFLERGILNAKRLERNKDELTKCVSLSQEGSAVYCPLAARVRLRSRLSGGCTVRPLPKDVACRLPDKIINVDVSFSKEVE